MFISPKVITTLLVCQREIKKKGNGRANHSAIILVSMKTDEYVAKWVFNIPSEKIDQLSDEFGVDFSNKDVEDAIFDTDPKSPKTIGAAIWLMFIDKLKMHFFNTYPTFYEEKFDWNSIDVGVDAIAVYYDGEEFNNVAEFEELLANQEE